MKRLNIRTLVQSNFPNNVPHLLLLGALLNDYLWFQFQCTNRSLWILSHFHSYFLFYQVPRSFSNFAIVYILFIFWSFGRIRNITACYLRFYLTVCGYPNDNKSKNYNPKIESLKEKGSKNLLELSLQSVNSVKCNLIQIVRNTEREKTICFVECPPDAMDMY